MSRYDIKMRLLRLGKTQQNVLEEVRQRGYPKLQYPSFNQYINAAITTPQAETVIRLSDEIIKEWEKGRI